MSHPPLPDWNAPALKVRAPAPPWFNEALAHPFTSHFVTVEACPIHYLRWHSNRAQGRRPGVLLVHGGGAHANWWRFVAPLLCDAYEVAALDLSGMGDSGRREEYSAAQRAAEIRAVLAAADLGPHPFVVGHSFGGYMTMRFGVDYGDEIAAAIIVDSPIRRPDDPESSLPRRALSIERHYPSFEIAIERFRLMPPQECANDFIVEFIARHSVRESDAGWSWKFDVRALGARRWSEPFAEHLANMRCPSALIYGQRSALVSADTAAYMKDLMGPDTPLVAIPDAHHHIMLDQPQVFVRELRALLSAWNAPGRA